VEKSTPGEKKYFPGKKGLFPRFSGHFQKLNLTMRDNFGLKNFRVR